MSLRYDLQNFDLYFPYSHVAVRIFYFVFKLLCFNQNNQPNIVSIKGFVKIPRISTMKISDRLKTIRTAS